MEIIEYKWLFELPSLLVIGMIGMFSHFLKKNVTGETLVEIKGYFSNHFKSTLLAVIATFIAVISYYFTIPTGQIHDILIVGSLGYNCDSLFNKWDKMTTKD